MEKKHLDSLNVLRGLAALMVCFGHFGQALKMPNNPGDFFNVLHLYGPFGVNIFFVISGFVIPLSFYNGNYDVTNYFKFLYKRLLRLHPPFLLAVALTIIIMLVSYKMRHLIFPETLSSIIATCFYMHVLPDNPVFWTLAIEAEYYIFIGLFYVLLIKYPKITVAIFVPVLMIFAKVPGVYNFITLFSYLDFFLIGTIGFVVYKKIGNTVINYLIIGGLIVFAIINYKVGTVVASSITILIILYLRIPMPRYLQFLGTISYSLYLIHFPVGGKLLNLLKPHVKQPYYYLLFLIVIATVIILAWLFCKLIEKPSEEMSRRLKYKVSK